MMFVTHLSRIIQASSIKVYLAGVRSLHIENGFTNPLEKCLRLERVIRGVKRKQGTGTRLPITEAILHRLHSLLTQSNYSDSLFWAACCTGFFGLLQCGEFTTASSSYDPKTHLSLEDVKVDRTTNPTVVLLRIKSSKTYQFRRGHTIRIGATHSRCARSRLWWLICNGSMAQWCLLPINSTSTHQLWSSKVSRLASTTDFNNLALTAPFSI